MLVILMVTEQRACVTDDEGRASEADDIVYDGVGCCWETYVIVTAVTWPQLLSAGLKQIAEHSGSLY